MMVIFVSQCEKKALSRTRRVLDAFADRIGDNTWQTVITQEGLNAVKKLLRKTASKNTAVSCHWIRSRSRSELVWIVGRVHAFNHRGIVPVNFTTKEVIMDRLPIETGAFLANTQGQALSKHLFAVGYVAYKVLDLLHINNPSLSQSAFIGGVTHDIGKTDPEFQNWVSKKSGKRSDNVGFYPDFADTSKKPDNGQKECLCQREENTVPSSNMVLLNKPGSSVLAVLRLLKNWALPQIC